MLQADLMQMPVWKEKMKNFGIVGQKRKEKKRNKTQCKTSNKKKSK